MRSIRTSFIIVICIMLCCRFEFGCIPSHDSHFSNDHLLRTRASDLTSTIVSPHLETPLNTGKNMVWCSTFQLAWNKACELIGEDIHFYQEPSMVEILNKRAANESDIDTMSYIAVAGHIRDGILSNIKTELSHKFKGASSPQLIPNGVGLRPQDIVAYSYLFKNLEFPKKFERLDKPIKFEQSKVSCFGIGEKFKGGHVQMLSQVSILDYKDRDDFIIELKTSSPIDQVFLIKTTPTDTLKTCVNHVLKRISNGTPSKYAIWRYS